MNPKTPLSQQDIMKFLDESYKKTLNGIPLVSPSIEDFANEYLSKHTSKEEACKDMMNKQILKCTTSGVLSGLGGIITLPVTLPANIECFICTNAHDSVHRLYGRL